MIVRALDTLDDWTFGRGKSNYLTTNDAVGQNIKTRLKSFTGDCFFDVEAGIDWFNLLGSKNLVGLILAIKVSILNTENVTSLVDLDTELDENRDLSVTYSVNTVYSVNESLTQTVQVP